MSRCYRRGCVECATKQLLEITQGAAKQAEQQMEGHPEMTDIVEQAERVLSTQTTCDGEPHPTEVHRRQAQALADAGLLAQPARTVPTREEIVDVILDTHLFDGGTPIDTADAILALMDGQPTVAEAKAQALEGAADAFDALQTQMNEHPSRRDSAIWLIDRAQQIRAGK